MHRSSNKSIRHSQPRPLQCFEWQDFNKAKCQPAFHKIKKCSTWWHKQFKSMEVDILPSLDSTDSCFMPAKSIFCSVHGPSWMLQKVSLQQRCLISILKRRWQQFHLIITSSATYWEKVQNHKHFLCIQWYWLKSPCNNWPKSWKVVLCISKTWWIMQCVTRRPLTLHVQILQLWQCCALLCLAYMNSYQYLMQWHGSYVVGWPACIWMMWESSSQIMNLWFFMVGISHYAIAIISKPKYHCCCLGGKFPNDFSA